MERRWVLTFVVVVVVVVKAGVQYKDVLLTQAQLRKLKAAGSPISNAEYQQAQEVTNSYSPTSLPVSSGYSFVC
jgi:uncharacterized membrane protein YukC